MDSAANPQPARRLAAYRLSERARTALVSLSAFALMATIPAHAQFTSQRPGAVSQTKPSADVPVPAATQPTPTQPASLLDQPPTQALVEVSPGSLKIDASNASLTQTLHRISEMTGMQVDGITGDERVFGAFGPGDPRDVITNLLHGTSYNIIMVGHLQNGSPRELLLSPKPTGPAVTGQTALQPHPAASTPDEDAPEPPPEDVQPPEQGGRPQPGPGQMQPHSPQELLQQMRQQQQQQDSHQPQ